MPTLRLIPADESSSDEPLRFPTEAVRAINDARSARRQTRDASSDPSAPSSLDSTQDVLDALGDLTRRVNALTEELDVLAHLGGDDGPDDDRPRAA